MAEILEHAASKRDQPCLVLLQSFLKHAGKIHIHVHLDLISFICGQLQIVQSVLAEHDLRVTKHRL